MKKLLLVFVAAFAVFTLSACNGEEEVKDYSDQTLVVYFVPSRPADQILEITAPLEDLLADELEALGFPVGGVEVKVSSTYEAAGEALLGGTGDIAFLPGGTYVAYKDVADSPVEVILAATRGGLSKDSLVAKDWNDGKATDSYPGFQVAYYKGLIIAGPSTAGVALAAKVNAGTELVWDDVKDLNWCVRSATSSSGYIYPAIWLQENFDGKTFADITGTVTTTGGYGDSMSSLATETCDVATFYADARRDYADEWETDYEKTDIWTETNVVGVTSNIMNDTISVSTVNLDADIIEAISQAFINIAGTLEGQGVMTVYSHQGYIVVDDSDYDPARAAAELAAE
ncbi:PhnD/SsuA/transferrin family substrate-binding protein [Candidatus Xianfuyuplasma coldseepsis]|uniref:PhnD/SsuA/transferrin family substrate-binding protein n=1 Tax=Candidatus Xianfuyuplasma coldseepsis TaxID=2782163 RepID=A0A7L7KPM0_9MOLU|nr:PhnD/SsuA/transferrin family substrate-binding protein [Xianfuyuplasma coldseepsis]QMS84617.1 PhnD/SsuA/transferrin family substrate-binding protein [Xianfuyuplasma coldseepsis]